ESVRFCSVLTGERLQLLIVTLKVHERAHVQNGGKNSVLFSLCLKVNRLSTLVLQTISLMLGETEKGAARFSALTSKQGSVTADLLLALVCDPELKPYNCNSTSHTELLFMAYQVQRVVLVLSFL
ncbi:DUF4551 domain containing protein, partial [Clarias magur]